MRGHQAALSAPARLGMPGLPIAVLQPGRGALVTGGGPVL
jgi:hypothetical protein